MSEEYKQGDEFKTGLLGAGAKRFKLEGKRQGRDSYSVSKADEDKDGPKTRNQRIMDTIVAQQQAEEQVRLQEQLADAQRIEQEAFEALERVRANAQRDDQDRRIYYTEDGTQAFYEDGTALSAEQMAQNPREEGASTWETIQDNTERLAEARNNREELEQRMGPKDEREENEQSNFTLADDELAGTPEHSDMQPGHARETLSPGRHIATSASSEYGIHGGIKAAGLQPAFTNAALHLSPEELEASAPPPSVAPKFG